MPRWPPAGVCSRLSRLPDRRHRGVPPAHLPTRPGHQLFHTSECFRGNSLCPATQGTTEDSKEMFKTRTPHTGRALALACALLAALLPSTPRAAVAAHADDKMKAEDVIAKHLEALGPQAARDAATTRIV